MHRAYGWQASLCLPYSQECHSSWTEGKGSYCFDSSEGSSSTAKRMSRIFHGRLTVLAAGLLAKVFVDFCSCYFHSSSAAAECGKRGRSVYKGDGDRPVLGYGHGRAFIRLSKYEADASRLSQGLRFPEVLLRGRCK